MCREPVDQAEDAFEKERLAASKKLFELTDLNGDGLITVDEFALMGLNQTKVHAEKKLSPEDEQRIKDVFVKKFFNEIDSSFQPVPYGKYKDYILRSVNHMDPGDFQAPVSLVSITMIYYEHIWFDELWGLNIYIYITICQHVKYVFISYCCCAKLK